MKRFAYLSFIFTIPLLIACDEKVPEDNCGGDYVLCNDECVKLDTDEHCGDCNTTCDSSKGESCKEDNGNYVCKVSASCGDQKFDKDKEECDIVNGKITFDESKITCGNGTTIDWNQITCANCKLIKGDALCRQNCRSGTKRCNNDVIEQCRLDQTWSVFKRCPSGAKCDSTDLTCVCNDNKLLCDDLCVDPDTDPQHCGGCDNSCPTNLPLCKWGLCYPKQQCTPDEIVCNDLCPNPARDEH